MFGVRSMTAQIETKQSNTKMKLSLKNPLNAKSCSVAVITIAPATMAASNAAADYVRVFNEKVSGMPLTLDLTPRGEL